MEPTSVGRLLHLCCLCHGDGDVLVPPRRLPLSYVPCVSYWIEFHDFVLTQTTATIAYDVRSDLCLASNVNAASGAYLASVCNSFAFIVRSLTDTSGILRGLHIRSPSHSSLHVPTGQAFSQAPHLHTPPNAISGWILLLHRGRQLKANDLCGGM
jgi:hypothetical protein